MCLTEPNEEMNAICYFIALTNVLQSRLVWMESVFTPVMIIILIIIVVTIVVVAAAFITLVTSVNKKMMMMKMTNAKL